MAEAKPFLNGPVPGQSLTAELGARPWQQPAKYTNVEDALEFYADKLTDPKLNDSLLDALETGMPVTSLAEVIVQASAMEGLHTVDVSIMLLPIIMELIAYVGDEAGVKYNMGVDIELDEDVISEDRIAMAMNRIKDKMPDDDEEDEPLEIPDEPMAEGDAGEQPNGLMARSEPESDQEKMEPAEEQSEAPSEAGPETNSLMARRA
jgi:hypothetical protein|tara:strand:+ start:2345 stop:2962 length:618 start_codon:yes stop_codon:yes gene_type:complete